MTLLARVGDSFLKEFRRPDTRLYILGSLLGLICGALYFEGIWTGLTAFWLYLFSSAFCFATITVRPRAQKLFWKRLSIAAPSCVACMLLFIAVQRSQFFQLHSSMANCLLGVVLVGEVALLRITERKLLPELVEEQELECL